MTRFPEVARVSQPISYVRKDAPPILLFHGTSDETVDVKHSDTFVEALRKAGAKDVTYIRVEDAGHSVFGQNKDANVKLMDEFFNRTLK